MLSIASLDEKLIFIYYFLFKVKYKLIKNTKFFTNTSSMFLNYFYCKLRFSCFKHYTLIKKSDRKKLKNLF